jgi:hypothetical protein
MVDSELEPWRPMLCKFVNRRRCASALERAQVFSLLSSQRNCGITRLQAHRGTRQPFADSAETRS